MQTIAGRKDSLLEDTMHLKDLDGVSEHFDNKNINHDLLNIRVNDADATYVKVKDNN